MALDKKELQKLSPEQRIKRLRELEKEKKKELDEADRLIKDSIRELQQPPAEEQEPPRPLRQESTLETQLENEEIPRLPDQPNVEYVVNLYGQLKDIGQAENPYESISRAAEINDKIRQSEQYHSQDERIKRIAEGTRRLMEEIFGPYRANMEYRP